MIAHKIKLFLIFILQEQIITLVLPSVGAVAYMTTSFVTEK